MQNIGKEQCDKIKCILSNLSDKISNINQMLECKDSLSKDEYSEVLKFCEYMESTAHDLSKI